MSFSEDLKQGISPYRSQIREVIDFLTHYIKNPVQTIRKLPNWDWPQLLFFYTATAATCGLISGLISLKIGKILSGLIVFPISATIGATLFSGFLYYIFIYLFKREQPFKLIFTIVALSALPYFVIYNLATIVAPIKLIGLAGSALLLIIGLSENTSVEKSKIIKFIVTLYLVCFIFWMFDAIRFRNETQKYKSLATPESFEKLNQEFSK